MTTREFRATSLTSAAFGISMGMALMLILIMALEEIAPRCG